MGDEQGPAWKGRMRVLGIDPGSLVTGYGVVEEEADRLQALAWGTVRTSAKQPLPERLKQIYAGLAEPLHIWQPDAVSVERVFFADNPKTALTLGHARGVALLTVAHANLPLVEYSALEIKMAVVGYGRAAKSQVQQMVKHLLHLEALPQPVDAADALAAAICHVHTQGFRRRLTP
jgi:crossover junction endodeoxyribonuclease RuvC